MPLPITSRPSCGEVPVTVPELIASIVAACAWPAALVTAVVIIKREMRNQ